MWNIISSNKLIDKHNKQKQHMLHIKRMRNIKATMKISQPFKPNFLFNKKKQLMLKTCTFQNQTIKEAQEDIDRKNHILLQNMKQLQRKSQDYWRKKQRASTPNPQNRKRLSQMLMQNKKIDQQNIVIGRRLTTIHSEYEGIRSLQIKNSSTINSFIRVPSVAKSRPMSSQITLKLKTAQNTQGDNDNQYMNIQNLDQMIARFDKKQNKQRCKTAFRRKIYTQNVQYL